MEAFTTLDAVAIPIDQPNLDTDQIIPARFLGKPREMQVGALFHAERRNRQRPQRSRQPRHSRHRAFDSDVVCAGDTAANANASPLPRESVVSRSP